MWGQRRVMWLAVWMWAAAGAKVQASLIYRSRPSCLLEGCTALRFWQDGWVKTPCTPCKHSEAPSHVLPWGFCLRKYLFLPVPCFCCWSSDYPRLLVVKCLQHRFYSRLPRKTILSTWKIYIFLKYRMWSTTLFQRPLILRWSFSPRAQDLSVGALSLLACLTWAQLKCTNTQNQL